MHVSICVGDFRALKSIIKTCISRLINRGIVVILGRRANNLVIKYRKITSPANVFLN